MATVVFYLGRALQVSGLALGLLVIILFFDPRNGEARLLIMTVISAGIFFGGHALTGAAGRRD